MFLNINFLNFIMKKGKKKKITDWQKTADHEKILIVVLISVIFLLAIYIGYDVYNSFHTKKEASYLNSAVISLNQERSELVAEIEALEDSVASLTQQNNQLTTDNSALESDLSTLQSSYDALQEDLDTCEDELSDCESSSP